MNRPRAHSSSQRSHWLCVAYAFPPINRSGTHRTLAFVKHLDRLGWDATVLTVEPQDEPLDMSLLREVPASTRVVRTPWVDVIEGIKTVWHVRGADHTATRAAGFSPRGDGEVGRAAGFSPRGCAETTRTTIPKDLREWISRLLITPDSRLGWIAPAVRSGLRAIRRRRPDVLYSTSPYMSAHLIALILSRAARLPWVADFRDPWRGNPFREFGFSSLERWDACLEWIVLQSATHVIGNTPTMMEQLSRRHPFVANKCTTILNGFDHAGSKDLTPTRVAPAGDFVLTHCGQFYGRRSPKVWFDALRHALDQSPELAGKTHIVLIGTESSDGRPLRDWAVDAGVDGCARVLGQKSHAETLSYMAGSDALMLAASSGAGGELQIPNKLFEYLAIRKPIIAACSANSPIVAILEKARAEAIICDPNDERALADAIARLATHRRIHVEDAWCGVDQFERTHRAAELMDVFRRVSRSLHANDKSQCNATLCCGI